MFSSQFIQQIRDATSLLGIIGEHVVLRKSGSQFIGLCPFHAERTPSFSVNEAKKLYHCYGCKKGGDLFQFVMEISGLTFVEAIEELAEKAGLAIPQKESFSAVGSAEQRAQHAKQALAFKLNRFVAAFFRQTLHRSTFAQSYLRSRGAMEEELLSSFYLGATEESWDGLVRELKLKQAPLELASELGLIRASKHSSEGSFDHFRNRVVFPILNLRGKVVGFGGRALQSIQGADDPKNPKYLNSPESFLFQKSKCIFGLHQAQKYIREKDEVIVVEGYFDVLALHQAGFRNAVATCGTALTSDHLHLLKRLASRVTILFDGDTAGRTATEKAMETGLEKGMVLYGATLPSGLDPDELLVDLTCGKSRPEGASEMSALLQAAEPILDSKMRQWVRASLDRPEEKSQAIKKIGYWLDKFADPIGRTVRIQWVQTQMGLPETWAQQWIRHQPQSDHAVAVQKPGPIISSMGSQGIESRSVLWGEVDRKLLQGLVSGLEYIQAFRARERDLPSQMSLADLLEHPAGRAWVQQKFLTPGLVGLQEKELRTAESYLEGVSDAQLYALLVEALIDSFPRVLFSEFEGAITQSLSRTWRRFSQSLKQRLLLAESERNLELQSELMKEYLDVQRKMKEFISFYDQE